MLCLQLSAFPVYLVATAKIISSAAFLHGIILACGGGRLGLYCPLHLSSKVGLICLGLGDWVFSVLLLLSPSQASKLCLVFVAGLV